MSDRNVRAPTRGVVEEPGEDVGELGEFDL